MWNGFFNFSGVEFANGHRTETYARRGGFFGLNLDYRSVDVPGALGHDPYVDPVTDLAPWWDPSVAESADFHGVYVTDVVGLGDGVSAATITDSVGDGGHPGRVRRTGRTVVFSAAIVAGSDAGAEFGLAWLIQVLSQPDCADPLGCNGETVQFFARPSGLIRDLRTIRRVAFINTPKVITQRKASCGSRIWMVTFTAYAGDPNIYGTTYDVVRDFVTATPTDYYEGPGVATFPVETDWDDPDCPVLITTPLYDPLRPALQPPPQYPEVPLNDYVAPTTWDRRKVVMPEDWAATRGELLPTVKVTTGGTLLRNLRVKFYPMTGGDYDPCWSVGDMVFTYVPADTTLTVDGPAGQVWGVGPDGARRNADSLVLSGDGTPLNVPVLTCGFDYLIAVDLEDGQPLPAVDIAVTTRNAIQVSAPVAPVFAGIFEDPSDAGTYLVVGDAATEDPLDEGTFTLEEC